MITRYWALLHVQRRTIRLRQPSYRQLRQSHLHAGEQQLIPSQCQGAAKAGCCDGTKDLQCIVPANTEAFCCTNEGTACGTECCAYGWTCCSSSSSTPTCCSDSYGQCCGGSCCEKNRQCCGGECCSRGFECSANGNSCVRKTTPVLTVTSTTVVSSQGTNAAFAKRVGEGLGVAGVVIAAAGLL